MTNNAEKKPFDDIRALVHSMPQGNDTAVQAAAERNAQLTKPAGSLGRMEELALWLARWSKTANSPITRPIVTIFATNHGVSAQNISAYPPEVTRQMVKNFENGGAAINQICKSLNLALTVFELALDAPTADICTDDAMSEKDCAATIAYGMEAVAQDGDLICLGEMGIGNTTIAAAIYGALYGGGGAPWAGAGTGLDEQGLAHKRSVIDVALSRLAGEDDPLRILARIGGREIAAMCGAIIAARHQQVPVLIDGFVSTAAAAILHRISPTAIEHCRFAHLSSEQAHRTVLQKLDARPLLDLDMRLGEGTGAALAAGLVRTAQDIHLGMATFDEARVSEKI